jgi:hypothetical protein
MLWLKRIRVETNYCITLTGAEKLFPQLLRQGAD